MVMCVSTAGLMGRGRTGAGFGISESEMKGWAGFPFDSEFDKEKKMELAIRDERRAKALEKQRLRMRRLTAARKARGVTSKGKQRSKYGPGVGEYHKRKAKVRG